MTDTQPLASAAELAARGSKPFPNESTEYRQARERLLAEEIELRRHIQRVAAMRRALPPGGEAKDYRFLDQDGKEIGLADLFGRHDTLFTYLWMYGPQRERPCPMCTSFVGSMDVPAPDIEQRLAIAIIGRSPVARQLAFARQRGWNHLKFYQTIGDDFARDYRMLVDGEEWAAVLVWKREGDKVRLFWAAEGRPGNRRPRPGSASRPRPHTAVEYSRRWTRDELVPEAGLCRLRGAFRAGAQCADVR